MCGWLLAGVRSVTFLEFDQGSRILGYLARVSRSQGLLGFEFSARDAQALLGDLEEPGKYTDDTLTQ